MAAHTLTRWASGVAAAAISITLATGARSVAHAAPLGGLPAYDHVAVVILENENASATYDPNGPAKYLNATRLQGAYDANYYATGHVSLDNYIAMMSGQGSSPPFLANTDCAAVNLYFCVQAQKLYANGSNFADQLETAGRSWKGYMDSMPSPCFHADYSPTALPPDPYQGNSTSPPAGNYADRHNPFIYFPDIIENDARCKQHVVPYTQLATDLSANALPGFSFITPDTCHDGHDSPTCAGGAPGGLAGADAWLSKNLPPLLTYLKAHNGLLLITSDEASTSDFSGCCAGGPCLAVCGLGLPGVGGAVGLVALGPHVKTGQIQTKYDHASLLRTLEDLFGISQHLNNAAVSSDMTDLFTTASSGGGDGTGTTGGGSNASSGVNGASASGGGLLNTAAPRAAAVPIAVAAAVLVGLVAAAGRRRRRAGARMRR
jgi:hypothetical protein